MDIKPKHRLVLWLGAAAALVLIIGVSVALAQGSGTQSTTPGQTQTTHGRPGPKGCRRGAWRGRGPGAVGQVTKVENNTITIKTAKGDEKSFSVNDQTKYLKRGGGQASLNDVTVGSEVAIRAAKPADSNGNPTAKAVLIGIPKPGERIVGQVSSVNGDSVTIQTPNGDKQVTIPGLTNGEKIGVVLGPDGSVRGLMYNVPQRPAGQGGPQPGANTPQPQTSTQSSQT